MLRSLVALATFVQRTRRRPPPVTFATVIRHLGGAGIFFLAILDSTPIPTFGGPDILTAILAARHREPWYYYALMATAGSVLGAYITFRMARHAGSGYLSKTFGERRVSLLLAYFERWGTGALVVSAAVPFPFPTSAFFAAAGVLNYPLRNFLLVVALGRAARYGVIAAIASFYGRHFIRVLRHPQLYWGWFVLMIGIVVILIVAAMKIRKRLEVAAEKA